MTWLVHNTLWRLGARCAAALALALSALPDAAATAKRTSGHCQGANLSPGPGDGPAIDAATVCLIDQVRAAHRLRPLQANNYLQAVAGAQVSEMVRGNYFADVRPSGQTPLALIAATRYAAHATHVSAAQNLGWATGASVSPLSIVTAWLNSGPHRTIMLSGAFRDIGVGVVPALPSVLARGSTGAIYAVEFGARRLAAGGTARRGGRARRVGKSHARGPASRGGTARMERISILPIISRPSA